MAATKKLLNFILLLLIVAILIGGGLFLHKKRTDKLAHVPRETVAPWALHVAAVNDTPVDSGFPALARLSTSEEITIMARISGRILKMGPREGVRVTKGDLLIRIDTREIADRINSLNAQLIAARAETTRTRDELQREKKLFTDSGSSKSAVQARQTAAVAADQKVKSLEHEINAFEVQQGYGIIESPTNGIIANRLVEPGDMAMPGHPLYTIASDRGALVQVELPQSILHEVHPGTPIVLFHNGQEITIPINRVFPTVDARALGFVEADLESIPFDLPSGSRTACRVILKQTENTVRVPYGSLLCGGDKTECRVARVVEQDKKYALDMVPVKVQLRGHEGIAVTGDLHAEELVVIAHKSILLQLANDDPVTIAKGENP